MQDDLSHLQDWCLAGADLNQPDYNEFTALHAVSILVLLLI